MLRDPTPSINIQSRPEKLFPSFFSGTSKATKSEQVCVSLKFLYYNIWGFYSLFLCFPLCCATPYWKAFLLKASSEPLTFGVLSAWPPHWMRLKSAVSARQWSEGTVLDCSPPTPASPQHVHERGKEKCHREPPDKQRELPWWRSWKNTGGQWFWGSFQKKSLPVGSSTTQWETGAERRTPRL